MTDAFEHHRARPRQDLLPTFKFRRLKGIVLVTPQKKCRQLGECRKASFQICQKLLRRNDLLREYPCRVPTSGGQRLAIVHLLVVAQFASLMAEGQENVDEGIEVLTSQVSDGTT